LLLGKVMAYVQGFHEISVAAREYGWEIDLGGLASIWRAGCIIRARLLDRVIEAFDTESAPPTLLADAYVRDVAGRCQAALRSTVMLAIEKGIAVPGLASTLSYYDGLRAAARSSRPSETASAPTPMSAPTERAHSTLCGPPIAARSSSERPGRSERSHCARVVARTEHLWLC